MAASPSKRRRPLPCPWCVESFKTIQGFRAHIRNHQRSQRDPVSPLRNKLLSRRSNVVDDDNGVFEFDDILGDAEIATCIEIVPQPDDDSYYSDYAYDCEYGGNENSPSSSDDDNDNNNDDDSDDDMSDSTFDPSSEDEDDEDNVMDYVDTDGDESNEDDDDTTYPYFTPKQVPDHNIPFSSNSFSPPDNFSPPSSFIVQLRLMELFARNKGSLKMYDEMIEIFNAYLSSRDFNKYSKLVTRKTFVNRVEKVFNTGDMRPEYAAVRLHNNTFATVPVFDMKTMILSILHDPSLMKQENFADGLNVFTGEVDCSLPCNKFYGEIHTGDSWLRTKERFCGKAGKYMPFGMVIFGDKSHTDLHGSLSVTPITFTATFFNRSVRNNPECWRPMAYLPNLAHGKASSGNSRQKVQDEHNCLALAFKSLIELSENGGIRTIVMGKEVIVKPFIHYFIGDTEGHNKWLGHYSGSKPGMGRPYRDCHCSFEQLSSHYPRCVYTLASEFRRAMRLVLHDKKKGLQSLKSMSRHYVNNALYQSKLPLSDAIHGANKMCPPETLHVMDAGITVYMQESLQNRTSAGQSRDSLNDQHCRLFNDIRRNSERDLPRGATRSGLIDSTRCQSSERKGNLFLMLCIATTVNGRQILQHELNYNQQQWVRWLEVVKLYLALGEWIQDTRPKKEVRGSRQALSLVIRAIQKYFPRTGDNHGYNIPKMHALAKMPDYICEFGSGINFYGGPGEASHKQFVKAPGLKTQRRVAEFATQTAEQYYTIMAIAKATRFVDIRSTRERARDEACEQRVGANRLPQYEVMGKYKVDILPNQTIQLKCAKKSKEVEKSGLDERLVSVMKRIVAAGAGTKIVGYTRAIVYNDDGEPTKYNAHPMYHGAEWYDWAYVVYNMPNSDGTSRLEYYASKIIGFIQRENEVQAVIQCSVRPILWSALEEKFICSFDLCSENGQEQIVPMSSLSDPLCVIKDYGASADKYLLVLPKREWSGYFARFVKKING